MKDIILLIRQRKEFYLTVLVLTLLLTIVGAFYNLSVGNEDLDERLNITSEEQMVSALAQNASFYTTGMSTESLMNGFMNNWTYMGYVGLNIIILAVMIFSYFNLSDKGTREFMETLPVKRVAMELYNYVALIGIFLLNVIVATVIHLIYMCNVNRQISALAEQFPQLLANVVPKDLVAANTASLLYQFGMLILFLFAIITFWFVFTTLFKKWAVGLALGLVLWYSISDIMYGTYRGEIPESFRKMVAPFDIHLYFDKFEWNGVICTNPFTGHVVTVLTVMIVVMIGVMIVHAYVRELSKGKLFYMNALNIVLLVFGGFCLYFGAVGFFGLGGNGPVSAAFITVIAEVVAIYLLYHKKEKTFKLAVKEKKKVSNPVLAQGLKSYLLAAGIITLAVQYIDVGINLEPIRHFIPEAYMWYGDEPWFLGYFDIYWRYQYAVYIVIGFIVFKCIQFAMERTKASREFYETLPVSRARIYCTKLLMDLGVIMIPLMVFTFTAIGYLLYFNRMMNYVALKEELAFCVGEQFLLAGIILCLAICLLGVMYLIDAVTVSGGMKNIYCGVVALFGFIVSIMVLEEQIPLLQEFVALIGGELNPVVAMVYLIIGIALLAVAGRLYIRRDKTKEIFYYKSAKYVFAILLSLCYLFFVLAGAVMEQSVIQYFLAIIGTVLIFCLTIYYCTPGHMAELQKKLQKKKKA